MKGRNVSYDGEEVFTAEALTWERVEPALPPRDCGGKIPAVSVCDAAVGDLLRTPEKLLKPQSTWKGRPKNAKVWCADDEWDVIAPALVARGVLAVIPEDEIFRVDGRPVLNGMFGVAKGGNEKGTGPLRLVMNLSPGN